MVRHQAKPEADPSVLLDGQAEQAEIQLVIRVFCEEQLAVDPARENVMQRARSLKAMPSHICERGATAGLAPSRCNKVL